MHLAAQYLTAAGISFLDKKEDDSHTNLGLSVETGRLETHPLSENGAILSLDYKDFSLSWNAKNGSTSFPLNGATHAEVLWWLRETSRTFLNAAYSYKFHYALPFEITPNFKFELVSAEKLIELLQLRILAQSTLEEILAVCKLESPIRVWPHHFDTGAYARLDNTIDIGFGLAIPDRICEAHYFYISGYKGHTTLSTTDFTQLSYGEWKNDNFKGAILPAEHIERSKAVSFFKEAINNYKIEIKEKS